MTWKTRTEASIFALAAAAMMTGFGLAGLVDEVRELRAAVEAACPVDRGGLR